MDFYEIMLECIDGIRSHYMAAIKNRLMIHVRNKLVRGFRAPLCKFKKNMQPRLKQYVLNIKCEYLLITKYFNVLHDRFYKH